MWAHHHLLQVLKKKIDDNEPSTHYHCLQVMDIKKQKKALIETQKKSKDEELVHCHLLQV